MRVVPTLSCCTGFVQTLRIGDARKLSLWDKLFFHEVER